MIRASYLSFILALAMLATPAMAGGAEVKVNPPICEMTTISKLGARLVDMNPKEAGSYVEYANGKASISYDYVPEFRWTRRSGIQFGFALSREK